MFYCWDLPVALLYLLLLACWAPCLLAPAQGTWRGRATGATSVRRQGQPIANDGPERKAPPFPGSKRSRDASVPISAIQHRREGTLEDLDGKILGMRVVMQTFPVRLHLKKRSLTP